MDRRLFISFIYVFKAGIHAVTKKHFVSSICRTWLTKFEEISERYDNYLSVEMDLSDNVAGVLCLSEAVNCSRNTCSTYLSWNLRFSLRRYCTVRWSVVILIFYAFVWLFRKSQCGGSPFLFALTLLSLHLFDFHLRNIVGYNLWVLWDTLNMCKGVIAKSMNNITI